MPLSTLLHLPIITIIQFGYAFFNSTQGGELLSVVKQVKPVCREYKWTAFSTLSNTCESFLKLKSVNFDTSIWSKHRYSAYISSKF